MEKPATRSALLPSQGYPDERPTRHIFSHYEEQEVRNYDGYLMKGWAFIYRCNETGALRKWGFE